MKHRNKKFYEKYAHEYEILFRTLKGALKAEGYTNVKLCDVLGVNHNTISKLLNNKYAFKDCAIWVTGRLLYKLPKPAAIRIHDLLDKCLLDLDPNEEDDEIQFIREELDIDRLYKYHKNLDEYRRRTYGNVE